MSACAAERQPLCMHRSTSEIALCLESFKQHACCMRCSSAAFCTTMITCSCAAPLVDASCVRRALFATGASLDGNGKIALVWSMLRRCCSLSLRWAVGQKKENSCAHSHVISCSENPLLMLWFTHVHECMGACRVPENSDGNIYL